MAKLTHLLVDRPESAQEHLRAIASSTELALDTEGASFHRFVDRIYLLQLSTRQLTFIVDPLNVSKSALDPLGRMLESDAIEVVFHDADYDLRLLWRDYGWHVRRIFDTRLAAQLLGIRAFGLAALLERWFGVKLDKKHQRADWSMRPLPDDMLEYAAQDTSHLLSLRDQLAAELATRGRASWAREEFARLEGTRWEEEEPGMAFLRVKGARDLSRRELAILRELVPWRDVVARELDRATFRVIGNEQLLEIARVKPRTAQELSTIRGISRGLQDRRAREILDAVDRGIAVPESELPRFPKAPRWDRDPGFDARVNALRAAREDMAVRLDLEPGVLCARDRLEAVARRDPRSLDELRDLPELRRWQVDVLGDAFVAALARVRR